MKTINVVMIAKEENIYKERRYSYSVHIWSKGNIYCELRSIQLKYKLYACAAWLGVVSNINYSRLLDDILK